MTVNLILDTDCNADPGDLCAVAVACAYHKLGHAKLLGVVVNDTNAFATAAVDVIRKYLGLPQIPVGAWSACTNTANTTTSNFSYYLTNNYAHDVPIATSCPTAVRTYRQLLVANRNVVICSIGLLNNLPDLLQSGADDISSLTGVQLVQQSVSRLVVMGGDYPGVHTESNFFAGPAGAAYACANWPSSVPIIFAGYSVGASVTNTAPSALPTAHPIYQGVMIHSQYNANRPAWDEMTVMLAVEDLNDDWAVFRGSNSVNASTGANTWTASATGPHYYVTKNRADAYYQARVVTLTAADPTASPCVASWGTTGALVGLKLF